MISKSSLSYCRQFLTAWRKSNIRRWISHHIECYFIPNKYRRALGRKEAGMLVRIGIRPTDIVNVDIGNLYVQQRSEWVSHQSNENCKKYGPVSISESYMADFLRIYQVVGKEILEGSEFRQTKLFQRWAAIDKVGFRYDWYDYPNKFTKTYPPNVIRDQAARLINVYENIKLVGYANGEFSNRLVSVLDKPFENTRFGKDHRDSGLEIWSGHNRAASLAVLGYTDVKVVLMKDIREHSNVR